LDRNLVRPSRVSREGERDAVKRRSRIDALIKVASGFRASISTQNALWQDCGRKKWKMTGNGWDQMSAYAKTLDFARGCNSIQINWLNFPSSLHSGP
jgi:hypothetical protein